MMDKKRFKPNPYNVLVLGYALITLIGAVLLSLPCASVMGKRQPFIDALFVSVSCISTSGLSVVDIGSFYTLFGQIVVMCLFQVGGIGYMIFVMLAAYILGYKLSLTTFFAARESLGGSSLKPLYTFFKAVLLYTMVFEVFGAVILYWRWANDLGCARAAYYAVFHSVSAFCTAGFGLFPDSLMRFRGDIYVMGTISIVSLAGGIGFIVLYELYFFVFKAMKRMHPRRLSLHAKIALHSTFWILIFSVCILYLSNSSTSDMSVSQRLIDTVFQAISASTTDGFNSVDIGTMSPAELTVLMVLMFIGASPGSTGGGIKTATAGIIIAFLVSQSQGHERDVFYGKRTIAGTAVLRSLGVLGWFLATLIGALLIMTGSEKSSFLKVCFEIVSALGNTGLSTGITPELSTIGRITLIIVMFIGRVGPLTIGYSFLRKGYHLRYRYSEEDVLVG